MKVSTIFTILLFLVALLGSIGGTSYYYVNSIDSITTEVQEHLESIAQSRGHHMDSLLEEQIDKIKIAATHQELSNDELKEIVEKNREYTEMLVIDSNGIIVASSEESVIGVDKSDDAFFIQGKKETNFKDVYFSDSLNEVAFAVYTPQGENNVLVARIDTEILSKITLDKTGIGETGETYLINSESYAITPLLFVKDAELEWTVDTVSARNCLSMLDMPMSKEVGVEHEGHEAVETYLDYRGEKVIGTHHPLNNIDWCLLAEINEEEVLGKQRKVFQRVSLTIVIVITIILTLIGFFVGKFIDKRVVLKKGGKKL